MVKSWSCCKAPIVESSFSFWSSCRSMFLKSCASSAQWTTPANILPTCHTATCHHSCRRHHHRWSCHWSLMLSLPSPIVIMFCSIRFIPFAIFPTVNKSLAQLTNQTYVADLSNTNSNLLYGGHDGSPKHLTNAFLFSFRKLQEGPLFSAWAFEQSLGVQKEWGRSTGVRWHCICTKNRRGAV